MRRQQLTETQIAALFDPPTEPRELVRHYTHRHRMAIGERAAAFEIELCGVSGPAQDRGRSDAGAGAVSSLLRENVIGPPPGMALRALRPGIWRQVAGLRAARQAAPLLCRHQGRFVLPPVCCLTDGAEISFCSGFAEGDTVRTGGRSARIACIWYYQARYGAG